MRTDYGYYFGESDVKAFVSIEALHHYRDVYLANRIELVKEDFDKMKQALMSILLILLQLSNLIEDSYDLIKSLKKKDRL